MNKLTRDSNFFEKIDNEIKAYFLGFMYADGYVNNKGLKISLQEQDVDILNRFKKEIKFDGNLYFLERSKKNPNWKNVYTLSIYDRKIAQDLINKGCIQNKTFKIEFPTFISHDLIRHFIRGYFDGDGYVGYRFYKDKYLYIQSKFVSTENFCDEVIKLAKSELGINGYKETRHPERNHNIRQLSFSGNKQSLKFLDWIYEKSSISLNRKYKKYLEAKSVYNNKVRKK